MLVALMNPLKSPLEVDHFGSGEDNSFRSSFSCVVLWTASWSTVSVDMALDDPGIFFFLVAGISKRSRNRPHRLKTGLQYHVLDAIDDDFLRHRMEETHLAEVEQYGCACQASDAAAERCIVGFIAVEVHGHWESPLTFSTGELRWSTTTPN